MEMGHSPSIWRNFSELDPYLRFSIYSTVVFVWRYSLKTETRSYIVGKGKDALPIWTHFRADHPKHESGKFAEFGLLSQHRFVSKAIVPRT
jgi:hypothetical protein